MRLVSLSLFALFVTSAFGQTAPIHFHNANKEAGLPVPGTKPPSEMKYIVQQMAGGVALFDCATAATRSTTTSATASLKT